MDNQTTLQRAEQVEEILCRFDESPDERAKEDAGELVRALMDIHAAGLSRMVDVLANAGQPGAEMLKRFAADETISGLLVLYGLHPVSLSERVRTVIADLQPMLNSHQAKVETIAINEGHLRLQIVAKATGCQSTGAGLKQLVEDAIIGAAPDLEGLELEITPAPAEPVLVPLLGLNKRELSHNESQAAA